MDELAEELRQVALTASVNFRIQFRGVSMLRCIYWGRCDCARGGLRFRRTGSCKVGLCRHNHNITLV